MPKTIKQDDPEQSKRFVEKAKEIGCDPDSKVFDKAFKKVSEYRPPKKH